MRIIFAEALIFSLVLFQYSHTQTKALPQKQQPPEAEKILGMKGQGSVKETVQTKAAPGDLPEPVPTVLLEKMDQEKLKEMRQFSTNTIAQGLARIEKIKNEMSGSRKKVYANIKQKLDAVNMQKRNVQRLSLSPVMKRRRTKELNAELDQLRTMLVEKQEETSSAQRIQNILNQIQAHKDALTWLDANIQKAPEKAAIQMPSQPVQKEAVVKTIQQEQPAVSSHVETVAQPTKQAAEEPSKLQGPPPPSDLPPVLPKLTKEEIDAKVAALKKYLEDLKKTKEPTDEQQSLSTDPKAPVQQEQERGQSSSSNVRQKPPLPKTSSESSKDLHEEIRRGKKLKKIARATPEEKEAMRIKRLEKRAAQGDQAAQLELNILNSKLPDVTTEELANPEDEEVWK